jgi:uncharacterized protein (TIGR00730 family)
MTEITSLCVFCGSKMGGDTAYEEAARELGSRMAAAGVRLVYGGGGIGLMGALAETVLAEGGRVTGVIPEFLMAYEVGDPGVTELVLTENMHERKSRMFDLSDAVVVLPGGLGTLDETFEIITWKQLQQHAKPVVILNAGGYWTPLEAMVDSIIENGFAHPKVKELYTVVDTPAEVLPALAAAPAPDKVVLTDHL